MRTLLIEQRKKRNMTQKELAGVVGVSEVFVRMIENGRRNPSRKVAMKFESFFQISERELFSDLFFVKSDTERHNQAESA